MQAKQSTLAFGFFLRLRDGSRCDLLQRLAEGVFVAISIMLARGVDKLLALRSRVRFRGFGFGHVANLSDLRLTHILAEVHHA